MRLSETLFKAVIQAVLLFWSEMWVMTPSMVRALGCFQNRVAQQIMGKKKHLRLSRIWNYPYLEKEIREAGLAEVEVYVLRRPNTAAQYITNRPILDLCE